MRYNFTLLVSHLTVILEILPVNIFSAIKSETFLQSTNKLNNDESIYVTLFTNRGTSFIFNVSCFIHFLNVTITKGDFTVRNTFQLCYFQYSL